WHGLLKPADVKLELFARQAQVLHKEPFHLRLTVADASPGVLEVFRIIRPPRRHGRVSAREVVEDIVIALRRLREPLEGVEQVQLAQRTAAAALRQAHEPYAPAPPHAALNNRADALLPVHRADQLVGVEQAA